MKKYVVLSVILFTGLLSYAQKGHYNEKKGYVAQGYDVVAYFDTKAQEGSEKFTFTHDGAKYKFVNASNRSKFIANPEMYVPQYGGWCAYAIGKSGKKVKINPETYEIRDGKLYLFYDFGSTDTLEKWIAEGAEELRDNADRNWEKITHKK